MKVRKGLKYLAAMIMAARAVIECRIELRGDIQINTVPDEEAGGMGSLDYVHRGIHSDGAIMTEPTNLEIGPMCRGILWGKITIPGRAGHIEMAQSHWSQGGCVDAVKLLQLYLNAIDNFNRYWAARKTHPHEDSLPASGGRRACRGISVSLRRKR